MAYLVVHTKTRRPTLTHWCGGWEGPETQFRYWKDRREVLTQRGVLLFENEFTTDGRRIRTEVWKSKADYDQFCDDICARVIDGVCRHEESLRGVIHQTVCSEIPD